MNDNDLRKNVVNKNNNYTIMKSDDAIRECFAIINSADDIVITTHINPDGDAIGSALGFYHYFKSKNKKAVIINHSQTPYNLKFLPGAEFIELYSSEKHNEIILAADVILVVDLNDIKRIKTLEGVVEQSSAKKIVIDHHIEPKDFADVYVIDTDATSTGELVWKILNQDNEYKCTKETAQSLYTAIMTDTGSFRFPRTDGEVHRIVAQLIDYGADPVSAYEHVYNNVPINTLKLLGEAFTGLEQYFDGKLCIMTIEKELFSKTDTNEDDVENFVENLLSIKNVDIGILVTELPDRNEYRLSMRAKGEYSVRDIAYELGGGGHQHAAGARIYNSTLTEVKKQVLNLVSEMFNNKNFNSGENL